MTTTTTQPQIYVACLAAYNAGILHGEWIECDQDEESIREEIQSILDASPIAHAEEFAIHDFEGFGKIDIGEYESIERVAALGALLADSDYGDAYGAYVDAFGNDCPDSFRERFRGEYDSAEDYAYELIDSCYDLERSMGNLACYFDYERFARDLELNGDITCVRSDSFRVFVFDNH